MKRASRILRRITSVVRGCCPPLTRQRKQNIGAAAITLAALGILYFNFDSSPADANYDSSASEAEVLAAAASTVPILSDETDSGSESHKSGVLYGHSALLFQQLILEKGEARLSQIPDYTANFCKRERVNGTLMDAQVMQLKVRHAPFSVYMKWVVGDKGRELLYIDGENNNEMLIKVGGVKGRLLPAIKLDPNSSLAMKESRHPVTKAGLLSMVRELLHHRREGWKIEQSIRCRMTDNQDFNGRNCYCFLVEFQDRELSPVYRKSVVYIDKELSLPLHVRNYSWLGEGQEVASARELDDATMIEHYTYSNIQLEHRLAAADFDEGNENYKFRRQ